MILDGCSKIRGRSPDLWARYVGKTERPRSHGTPKVLHVGQRKSQSHAPQRDQSQKLRAMNWFF